MKCTRLTPGESTLQYQHQQLPPDFGGMYSGAMPSSQFQVR
jgi:hypothetical protein